MGRQKRWGESRQDKFPVDSYLAGKHLADRPLKKKRSGKKRSVGRHPAEPNPRGWCLAEARSSGRCYPETKERRDCKGWRARKSKTRLPQEMQGKSAEPNSLEWPDSSLGMRERWLGWWMETEPWSAPNRRRKSKKAGTKKLP